MKVEYTVREVWVKVYSCEIPDDTLEEDIEAETGTVDTIEESTEKTDEEFLSFTIKEQSNN